MAVLEYKFTNDMLFKMVFVRNQGLLKKFVADLLHVPIEEIGEFRVTNEEMPAEEMGKKLGRLDINMAVGGRLVDLEIQVRNEGDYPERTLFYWAREYSSALGQGEAFSLLPRTIVISIVAFPLFKCKEYHSEFEVLEVTRHERLTDRLSLQYFELPKLPPVEEADDKLKLWLALFKADTDEEMTRIKSIGGEIMEQAVDAYHRVTATDEFKQRARMMFDADCIEASALYNARRGGLLEGRQEGLLKGRQEGLLDAQLGIAKNLLNEGMDASTIARLTGLTIDEVLHL
jgi:predicted transposase/invertase (TIGR01784 family)